jgi:UDP-3-O-[3-hydroxymyristoyl] glucosamine N-acyltransferase
VTIGPRAHLIAHVSIYPETVIGADFRAHAGVVIGSDGFGYAPIKVGGKVEGHQKIWHLGHVRIGDRVEIGANSCADRGTLGNTIIEDDVKIDNLCHVGHNARLGQGAVLCGGVLLAGRAVVERFAYIGGNTGITNGVVVGAGALVGATSLVTKDVPPGGTAVGNPQREYSEHFRAHAALNRLMKPRMKPRVTPTTKPKDATP